jgi:hypothetical protein
MYAADEIRLRNASSDARYSCQQCRARKVKCDRVGNCCGPCSRLSLPCSYRGSVNEADQDPPPDATQLTEAGIKRRRIRCACVPCRAVKAKCSGETPCSRCMSRNIDCVPRMQIENNSRNRPVVQLFDDRPSINTESGIPTPVTSIQTIHDIQ